MGGDVRLVLRARTRTMRALLRRVGCRLVVLVVERTAALQQLVDPAELRLQDRLSLDDALSEHPLRDAALEQLGELLGRHRPAEVVALRLVALLRLQERQLLDGLHALGDHPQLQAARHARSPRVTMVVSSPAVLIWRMNDWSILRASIGNFRR